MLYDDMKERSDKLLEEISLIKEKISLLEMQINLYKKQEYFISEINSYEEKQKEEKLRNQRESFFCCPLTSMLRIRDEYFLSDLRDVVLKSAELGEARRSEGYSIDKVEIVMGNGAYFLTLTFKKHAGN